MEFAQKGRGGISVMMTARALSSPHKLQVLLLDHADMVQVDALVNCKVFVGASSESIFVRECTGCTFTIACKQLRTRDCKDCVFHLYSKTEPIIETSSAVAFGPFNGAYAEHAGHMAAAGLDVDVNFWWAVFDFNDEIFWPNGGEIYADINTYMYSHEDSSIFFWVEDDSGNDLNVLCRDGTTLGGSWPSAWSTGERVYMPGYTCPSRTGTGSEYSFRYHGVVRSSFSRTLDAFHFTSFQSDNGTGGDWSYLYDLRVMVR